MLMPPICNNNVGFYFFALSIRLFYTMATLMLAFGSPGENHKFLSLCKTDVGNSLLCSSFCISTVQHAFPSSVLLGSGWHHVSDHQHAGVRTHTHGSHVTAAIKILQMLFWKHKQCLAGRRCCGSVGWHTRFCPLSQVSSPGSYHLACFLGHYASLLNWLRYCVQVHVCVSVLIRPQTPFRRPSDVYKSHSPPSFLMLQVANLFGLRRSTIITLYNGAFDSSSALFLVIKVSLREPNPRRSLSTHGLRLSLLPPTVVIRVWHLPPHFFPLPLRLRGHPPAQDVLPVAQEVHPLSAARRLHIRVQTPPKLHIPNRLFPLQVFTPDRCI